MYMSIMSCLKFFFVLINADMIGCMFSDDFLISSLAVIEGKRERERESVRYEAKLVLTEDTRQMTSMTSI